MAFINTFQASTQIDIQEAASNAASGQQQTAMVVLGMKTASGSATVETLTQVFSDLGADELGGIGSELAVNTRWAIKGLKAEGALSTVPLYVVALADPAGTARLLTATCGGTPTAGGVDSVTLGGITATANVAADDTPTDRAAALVAAINAKKREILFTAAINANPGEVEALANNTGVNANAVVFSASTTAPGATLAIVQTTAGVGSADLTNALAALEPESVQYLACPNNEAADVTDMRAHVLDRWTAQAKRWRWLFFGQTGATALTSGDALAAAADYRGLVLIASVDHPIPPGQLAAYMAARAAGESDPNRPFDDMELDDLPLAPARLLDTERETFGRRGLWLLDLNARGTRMVSLRGVTTQTTIDGEADLSQIDITTSRSQVELARRVDSAIERNFPRAKKTERNKKAVRDVCYREALDLERATVLRNVEALSDQFTVLDDTDDPGIPADTLQVNIPADVIPALRNKQVTISLIV